MRTFSIIVIILCCILISCLGADYVDLGNHYAWIDNREIVKVKEEKNNCLYYDVIIRPQVLNYDTDDRVIIVYQVYDGSDYYDTPSIVENRDSLLALYDKIKKIKFCYWIIDKETGKVFGPMKKKEFENRCKVMHIEAKMKQWQEKAFWEGREMQSTSLDSVTVK